MVCGEFLKSYEDKPYKYQKNVKYSYVHNIILNDGDNVYINDVNVQTMSREELEELMKECHLVIHDSSE